MTATPITPIPPDLEPVPGPIEGDQGIGDEKGRDIERLSRRRLLLRRFLRNRLALIGSAVMIGLVLLAVLGPVFYQWDHVTVDRGVFREGPQGGWRFWEWFQGDHWFGTTQSGNDVFALTIEGLRVSLMIGVSVAVISTTIAAVVGSFAAYFGGRFERSALWVIDLLLIIPSFLLVGIIMSRQGAGLPVLGSLPGPALLVIILALLSWMLSARVVRSMTTTVKEREYVVAARYMGVRGPTIVFRHILPNVSSLLIIDSTLAVAYAILAESSLSYFGLGLQTPDTSLGTLIGQNWRAAVPAPWLFWFPAGFLVIIVTAVNFIGDGLRDALDPTSKSSGSAG